MQAARAAGDSPTKIHQGVPCRDAALFTEVPEDCVCPIGGGVMTDPQIILVDDCEHEFCSGCIRRVLTSERSECPQCRRPFTIRDLRGLRKARLRALDLGCYCDNREDGCDWVGKYGMLDGHLLECRYATRYRCPFHFYGCGFNGPSPEVDHHLLMNAQEHLRLTCERLEAYGDASEFAQAPSTKLVEKQSGGITEEQCALFKDLVVKSVDEGLDVADIPEQFRARFPEVAWSVLRCLKSDNVQYIHSLGVLELVYGFYTWTLIANKL
eukprot:TRINITY_DN30535_c0_g1_i1.p1 TRINITY_DN30535_c0_g1~~TRINITY_DN30535_c0_g1_i1.p1  ORF type:complete len:268 (+),score=77.26 TRINITY_DN30535_c0_g1_i1:74-877(+)